MTLIKRRPKRPSLEHRKRVGLHHRHGDHYLKTYWPYMPMVAIVSLGLVANAWLGQLHRSVLGYATDMSVSSLLVDTNLQRNNNHQGSLSLNAKLGQAAQAKANDMAAKNYWSHNSPSGQTPWSFMLAASYNYQTAGENLAYGFATAADTVTGWMNSAEHRANILNTTYHDVGFGIVNIPNYQGTGPETLVVAMYGSVLGETAPVYAPPHVASTAPKPATHQASPAPVPSPSPSPADKPANPNIATTKPAVKNDTLTPSKQPSQPAGTAEPKQQSIARIQLVSAVGDNSWGVFMASLLGVAGFAFLLLRHSLAWRKVLVRGEHFVLHHPMADVIVVTLITLSFVLSRTAGIIR